MNERVAKGRPETESIRVRMDHGVKRRQSAKAMLRIGFYCLVVSGSLGLLFVNQAKARASEALVQLGRQLKGLEVFTAQPRRVLINGESVHFASTSVELGVREVLDRYAAHCQLGDARLREREGAVWSLGTNDERPNDQANDLPTESPNDLLDVTKTQIPGNWRILRRSTIHEGMVACLATDKQSASEGISLVNGLLQFATSLELGEIGELRYVYAHEKANGDTHVMTVWTQDGFNLGALFASPGQDAPGEDMVDTPRPVGFQRVLSITLEGTPFGIWIYQCPEVVPRRLSQQREAMLGWGWRLVSDGGEAGAFSVSSSPKTSVYTRDDGEIYFSTLVKRSTTALAFSRTKLRSQ